MHKRYERMPDPVKTAVYLLSLILLAPALSYAYIDPNTGGYVFQILFPIISAIVTLCLFFKNQVVRIFRGVTGLFRKDRPKTL